MSDEDWKRLAEAEFTHDRQSAAIEVDHLHGAPRLHRVPEETK